MAIEYLKRGKSVGERADDDAAVRQVVETHLADIEARGDTAVRELAEKFDSDSRDTYRLTEDEIQALIAQVAPNDICLLYTSPSPRDRQKSRMPSSA